MRRKPILDRQRFSKKGLGDIGLDQADGDGGTWHPLLCGREQRRRGKDVELGQDGLSDDGLDADANVPSGSGYGRGRESVLRLP